MDDLTTSWKKAREAAASAPATGLSELLVTAQRRKRSSLYFQYGNVLVLTLTLLGISLFFAYVAPLKTNLSHCGMALMIGSLMVRIGLEIRSIYQAHQIQLGQAAAHTARQTVAFYRFRQQIHGPVTLSTVALYSLGFYLLTPEFSHHFALRWLVLMDGSYVVGAGLLIWQIRRGIRDELQQLADLVNLTHELESAA
ncbi:hypothetical protein [uncultured Hymenobacter sp.]|uniref:hypothetical protein n=1 Tax=uncultured Hymenobacter sp. TaxID=170016 RepID=UPI0035CC4277